MKREVRVTRIKREKREKRLVRAEEEPVRKYVKRLVKLCRNRLYLDSLIEKETDETEALIRKRCDEYGIEIPTMITRIEIILKNRPNSSINQAIDWDIVKNKRLKRK